MQRFIKIKPGDWLTVIWKEDHGGEQDFFIVESTRESISGQQFSIEKWYRVKNRKVITTDYEERFFSIDNFQLDPRMEVTLRHVTPQELKNFQTMLVSTKYGL